MVNGTVQDEIMNTGRDIGLLLVPVVHGMVVTGYKEKVAGIGKKDTGDKHRSKQTERGYSI
jgi:hypothetical protein